MQCKSPCSLPDYRIYPLSCDSLLMDNYGPPLSHWGQKICLFCLTLSTWGLPGGSVVKNLPANAGDVGLIPDLGRSPRAGNDNPLQCFCLENAMARGAWWATVHRVTKSQTQLSDFTSLAVQWLKLCFRFRGMDLIPNMGTKIPLALRPKIKRIKIFSNI